MSALSFRRLAAVWALVLSGALIVFATFMDPAIDADGVELARAYAENPERIQFSAHGLRLAFALPIVPVFVLISMIRSRGAWLANVAGICAVLGMTTLPGLLVVDFYDLAIYDELGAQAWQAVTDRLEQLPGMMAMFLSAFIPFVLALPIALVASWRAGLLAWWPAVLAFASIFAVQVVPGGTGLLIGGVVQVVLGFALYRMFKAHPDPLPANG